MRRVSEKIQRPYGQALGDCWSVISYFINLASLKNEICLLSLWYPKGESIKRADKLKEILPEFDNDDLISLGNWAPTEPKINWKCGYAYPEWPTKIKWKPNKNKKICYQFDGKSKKAKNFPSQKIEELILSTTEKMGYETIRLGAGMSIRECLKTIAQCEIFLGIDSGMCHLASSAGIPIFFCKNDRPLEVWTRWNHSNKHFVLATDYKNLIKNIEKYKNSGLEYYLSNATNVSIFKNRLKNCEEF